jgi:hypothetical protein
VIEALQLVSLLVSAYWAGRFLGWLFKVTS